MTDLIQTIAKAMCESSEGEGTTENRGMDGLLWWEQYLPEARAAMRALHDAGYAIVPREPTEAMQEAGQRAKEADPYPANTQIYRAMIAAITTGERNG